MTKYMETEEVAQRVEKLIDAEFYKRHPDKKVKFGFLSGMTKEATASAIAADNFRTAVLERLKK